MPNPYFSVGEEVILQSKDSPELNGEYVVEAVFGEGDTCSRTAGRRWINKNGYGYFLEGECHMAPDSECPRVVWRESALRKKHKPSTDSFTEMMSNINEKVTQ